MIPGPIRQRAAAPDKSDPIRTDTDYNFYKLYYLMDPTARWTPLEFFEKIEIF
ncbi:hypothetical protein [Candidatus Bodocaedibacter vickermanii]|uniref:hypothetical protein n=1 Tax=Candidatus Bodocaedibacter vickermanii TaxID=2741701 RepID=UPI0033074605